ncbi:MAG TPA: S4 domain-containing protein [Eggerthellaceae bacterium]|nr:S4 domain-containing protein [Eggerthellaceae bacterium]
MRLQKFLARAGAASRRGSENLMTAGRVTVNGEVVTELGSKVDPARRRWWRWTVASCAWLTAPSRSCCTSRPATSPPCPNPQGRPTVAELVPAAEHAGAVPHRAARPRHHGPAAVLHGRRDGARAPAPARPCGKGVHGARRGPAERGPARASARGHRAGRRPHAAGAGGARGGRGGRSGAGGPRRAACRAGGGRRASTPVRARRGRATARSCA